MDYYLIFGMVVVAMIAIFAFIHSIKQETIKEQNIFLDLKICITQLTDEIKNMNDTNRSHERRIEKHGLQIDALGDRVAEVEHKQFMFDSELKEMKGKKYENKLESKI